MNKKKIAVTWLSLVMMFGFIVIIVDVAPPTKAAFITVDDSGGADFTKIQDAINASTDGDTIYVYSGTYYDHVVINKTINLTGENKNNTIIDGCSTGDVLYITANWVNVTDLTITNSGGFSGDSGIEINEVSNCKISNCNVTDNLWGIKLYRSDNNTIIDCTCFDNSNSLLLSGADDNIMSNNTISNSGNGIRMGSSQRNFITNNTIYLSDYDGIHLTSSSSNVITGNSISFNTYIGIHTVDSGSNTIIDNQFIDSGIFMEGSNFNDFLQNIDTSNIANGKPIYYFIDQSNLDVDGWDVGQIFLINCSDSVINNINASFTSVGIELVSSTSIHITNSTFSDNYYSVYLWQSSLNTFVNNTVSANWRGVTLWESCDSNMISNNLISSNINVGIYLVGSSSNNITYNSVSDNYNGISLVGCILNTISNNSINKSEYYYGIQLYSSNSNTITNNSLSYSYYGIYMEYSSSNIIADSTIFSNNFGFWLDASGSNTIMTNSIYSNSRDGLWQRYSYWNSIINNSIFLNGESGIKVYSSNMVLLANNTIHSNNDSGVLIEASSSYVSIANNNVSNNSRGICLDSSNENNVTRNMVFSNNEYGIHLKNSLKNLIYHNNIIDNANQSFDDSNMGNQWDKGYPKGGNYWSDYGGVDNYKGPDQDIPGSDGIGDTNYSIDSDSVDLYPLMEPYTYKLLENYTILKQGWNLISLPLTQDNQNLTKVLEMINGYYDAVQWYNITDKSDPWKHYKVGKPYGNDLYKLNETLGFWIYITNPGDTIFLYNGTQQTVNQTITLYPGWNLVGYPSLISYNRTEGLNNLTFGSDVDAIWTYNAATQNWKEITVSDYFEVGRGYWIHSKVTITWIVPL